MFTVCYIGCPENWRIGMFWLLLIWVATVPAQDQPQDLWTLEDSIRRVIEIAPETRGAQAAVNARQGALEQAGASLGDVIREGPLPLRKALRDLLPATEPRVE